MVTGRALAQLSQSSASFLPSALLLALVTALVYGGTLFRDALTSRLLPMLQCFTHAELLDRLLDRHRENFEVLSTGEILYILGTVPDLIGLWFRYAMDYIVPYTLTFLVATVILFRFDTALGGVFLLLIVLILVTFVVAPRSCLPHAGVHAMNMGGLHNELEDIVQNMEAVLLRDHATQRMLRMLRHA